MGKKAELLFTDGTTKVVETDKNYAAGSSDAIAQNHIVTFKVDKDGVYTLREVDEAKASYKTEDAGLLLKNDKAAIAITADNTSKTVSGTTVYTRLNTTKVTANSASVFVISDSEDYAVDASTHIYDIDDFTAYTGIKNAPTIDTTGASSDPTKTADVYLYCKSGKMVTVAFIIPHTNVDVDDESSNTLFIASESASNLIHDEDGDYYEFNAIVNGEFKTVKVTEKVKINNGDSSHQRPDQGGQRPVQGLLRRQVWRDHQPEDLRCLWPYLSCRQREGVSGWRWYRQGLQRSTLSS